jgi:hypothetical protein
LLYRGFPSVPTAFFRKSTIVSRANAGRLVGEVHLLHFVLAAILQIPESTLVHFIFHEEYPST